MEIRKGIVTDQGYDDVNCTFGITSDGKQYYFIENGELKDNKVIASTVLKEAIRHAKDTSLGVIDLDGNVIIPFENKVIKLIEDNYLLVERTVPKDKNVISSLASRNDPLSATRLVTTAAGLKEKMNNKMGANARFIFNDQFSEAALFDLEGNNVTNGDYFSYIGINNNNLYFCKNMLESDVKSYSISKKEEVKEEEEVQEEEKVTINKELVEGKLDVLSDSIDSAVIAASINDEMKKQEISQKDENTEQHQEVASTEEKEKTLEEISQETNVSEKEKPQQEEADKEVKDQPQENKMVDIPSIPLKDVIDKDEKVVSESIQNEISLPTATIPDKIDFSIFKDKIPIQSEESKLIDFPKVDYKENYHNKSLEEEFVVKDTIIEEVRDTMKDLILQNKEQQETIDSQEKSIGSLESENKEIREKSSDQIRKISLLEARIKNYEAMISKLEAKNQMLESKNHTQEKTIAKQEDELNILRPQVEGKKDLVALLADAKNILGNDNVINYDFETYTKSKVA